MRKWMRNRQKRRKQPAALTSEAAPAPLQPAYFDAEPLTSEAASEPAEQVSAPEPMESPQLEGGDAGSVPATDTEGSGEDRPRRRRRRGRGGRGRNRGDTPSVAPAPASEGAASRLEEPAPPPSPAPQQMPAPPPAAVASRPSKGIVVLAIGLPGSGKSSWFKRHNITPLSSDLLRALLFDDATEQRFQDLVFSNLRSMLKARLIARRPLNYVDATNLTPHDRHGWIKLARDFGYEVQAVFFDVPVEVCLQRNQRRSRVVAEDVMRRMAAKLKSPTFDEGFSKITVVKVKQKE
ncbi:MAG TPA: AAA family ATPase [Terriglobales bacterium]|nr:AAA family ATPase [Terriglobales bacterium]